METKNTPNLSLDPAGGRLVGIAGQLRERYGGMKLLSEKRNIPLNILKIAKSENAPGMPSNGEIRAEYFLPWLKDNYSRLEAIIQDREKRGDHNHLQEQKLKEEIVKLRNYNRSHSDAFISRKLVFETIDMIRNKWTEYLRQKLEYELPSKCGGMSVIELREVMTKVCDDLLLQFSKPLSKWTEVRESDEEDEEELNEDNETKSKE